MSLPVFKLDSKETVDEILGSHRVASVDQLVGQRHEENLEELIGVLLHEDASVHLSELRECFAQCLVMCCWGSANGSHRRRRRRREPSRVMLVSDLQEHNGRNAIYARVNVLECIS